MSELPPPYIISWNLTRRCHLQCKHCYMDSAELAGGDESSEEKALAIVDELAAFSPGAMLILTGGEPLLRPDIYEIISRASKKGLTVFLGTSGTGLDEETVRRLKEAGTRGVGVSLDSPTPAYHDEFRGLPGAWEATIKSMENLRGAGLDFQVQFTITEKNRDQLQAMIGLSLEKGAMALNVFFMVCTGRASKMMDIRADSYEAILSEIAESATALEDRIRIRARCAPHFLRILEKNSPDSPILASGTSGCIAGSSYMRISPIGEVTPCPYIPAIDTSPLIGSKTLRDIWEGDEAFIAIRGCGLTGRCGECSYKELCGGCRARALANDRELNSADPACLYEPAERGSAVADKITKKPVWTSEATARLKKAPRFLRPMISKGLERYARHKGIERITPELMAELKGKTGRGR